MADKNNEANSTTKIAAYNRIPYALINEEVDGSSSDITNEFAKIMEFYDIFKKGADFSPEGSNGDYVPATLRYKMAANLIKKEARFLFAEVPDIKIEPKGDIGKVTEETKNMITSMQDLVDTILRENKFEDALIKAARDCLIGKRVALVANFNEDSGVTVSFLQSIDFVYETAIDNPNKLTKFVSFTIVKNRTQLADKRIFKKKFELVRETNGSEVCYLQEDLYDGCGKLIENITEYQPTLLNRIPVAIILNDGLTNDESGESEIEWLNDYESWYSKLSNGDIDAGRKSMNPIRYAVDMSAQSTKGLSTAPGSFWDLSSDQNAEKVSPKVGQLESTLGYSSALDLTLKRIKKSAYDEVDMPDVEEIQAQLSSGKALKAIYWSLMVRCKEKMKTWRPQLEYIIKVIVDGAILYPNCIDKYTDYEISPVAYEVNIEQNYPLPEDETEEKQNDLAEVAAMTMSKKAYMKKWRGLTDKEAQEELEQMALERQLLEEASFGGELDSESDDDIQGEEEIIETEGTGDTSKVSEKDGIIAE